jgi:hypothetical protein
MVVRYRTYNDGRGARRYKAPFRVKQRGSLSVVDLDEAVVSFARNLSKRPKYTSGKKKGKYIEKSFYSPHTCLNAAAKKEVLDGLPVYLTSAVERIMARVDKDKVTRALVDTYVKGSAPKHVDSLITMKLAVRGGRVIQVYISQRVLDSLVDELGDLYVGSPYLDAVIKALYADTTKFYSLALGIVPGKLADKVENDCIKIAKEEVGFKVCAQSSRLDGRVKPKRGEKKPAGFGAVVAAGIARNKKEPKDQKLKCPNGCGVVPFFNLAGLSRHLSACTGPDYWTDKAAGQARWRAATRAKKTGKPIEKIPKKWRAWHREPFVQRKTYPLRAKIAMSKKAKLAASKKRMSWLSQR